MTIRDLVRPDFPNIEGAFWDGFASLFDFRNAGRKRVSTMSPEGDASALERDWRMIGDDLRTAMKRIESK